MKVALIGATGAVGSRLLRELTDRGHDVTAIARHAAAAVHARAHPVDGDIADPERLAAILAGHDAVISAVPFARSDSEKLLRAVIASQVPRYLVVGGAGSLEVAPGRLLVDEPAFPAEYLDEARAGGVYLERLKREIAVNWTFLSPPAHLDPGERTGRYRLGGDELITGDGGSQISYEDYAVAMADELETPRHSRRRFSVGY